MREVLDVLDRLGIDWFVTGWEAAACYGVPRLYPNERARWYTEVLEQLRAAHAAGTWAGFARPGPVATEQR